MDLEQEALLNNSEPELLRRGVLERIVEGHDGRSNLKILKASSPLVPLFRGWDDNEILIADEFLKKGTFPSGREPIDDHVRHYELGSGCGDCGSNPRFTIQLERADSVSLNVLACANCTRGGSNGFRDRFLVVLVLRPGNLDLVVQTVRHGTKESVGSCSGIFDKRHSCPRLKGRLIWIIEGFESGHVASFVHESVLNDLIERARGITDFVEPRR
jgi:hypothetical protein